MQPTDRIPPRRNFGRLLQMPLPELVYRGKQETSKIVDRLHTRRPAGHSPEENHARLNGFIDNCQHHFFAGAVDPRVPGMLSRVFPDECQMLLVEADRAFHGNFDLLGYKNLHFGTPIDWLLEPVANRRAPAVHWSRIDPLDESMVGDSKVVWELNRHQWLVHLAQAWRMTRYERYPEAILEHIGDWLAANPFGKGINWASSLEVSFRLIAWCWTHALIHDASIVTPAWFAQFERAIADHAMHIERYLSLYFSPNTHLTGEALGLFYAGVLFPDLEGAEQWRNVAAAVLEAQMEEQVYRDGVYFEQSTCYQRYTIDIYLHFLTLAARSGIAVSATLSTRVKEMLHVLIALRNPDGSMPAIGDEDGGVLLPLGMREACDYSPTFSTAAVVLRDRESAWAAGSLAPESLWLLGADALAAFETAEKEAPSKPVEIFRDGGIGVMRSGFDARSHSLIFDVGPLGCRFSSGHGHADLLSMQCSAFGKQYIVDPGTYCYTADRALRDYFRGTTAHSTIVVDGKSQAESAGPFAWKNKCAARLVRWTETKDVICGDAEHDAYGPVVHRRRVAFIRSRYWVVVDDVSGSGEHRIDLRFQFAPLQLRAHGLELRATDGAEGLLVSAFSAVPLTLAIHEGARDPLQGWISRQYGTMEAAPAAVFTATAELPLRIVTLLYPLEDADAPLQINPTPGGLTVAGENVVIGDEEITV